MYRINEVIVLFRKISVSLCILHLKYKCIHQQITKILLDEQPIAYDNSELTIRNMVIMNKQQFSSNE